MKRYIFIIFLLAISSRMSSFAQSKKDSTLTLFKTSALELDLKFIDPAKGSFGIDHQLILERSLKSINSTDGSFEKGINLNLNSKGFTTVSGDKNQNNSIINELKVEAFPLLFVKPKQISENESWQDAADDADLISQSRSLANHVASPFWLFFNIHGKHETTQDFKNYDFALGSQLSIATSILNKFLDFPFNLLRSAPNNNPRALDLSIGYDYVIGLKNTDLSSLSKNNSNMNRLNLKAEWETGIFTKDNRLVFLLDSYHDLDAATKLKEANKNWNYFYMIKLDHLLAKSDRTTTKVSVKYTHGGLPPNFDRGFVLGGGFSLEF